MIRRPPRSTHCISSAASDVYKRQNREIVDMKFLEPYAGLISSGSDGFLSVFSVRGAVYRCIARIYCLREIRSSATVKSMIIFSSAQVQKQYSCCKTDAELKATYKEQIPDALPWLEIEANCDNNQAVVALGCEDGHVQVLSLQGVFEHYGIKPVLVPWRSVKPGFNCRYSGNVDVSEHVRVQAKVSPGPVLVIEKSVLLNQWKAHSGHITHVSMIERPEGMATAGMDRHVKLWSINGALWGNLTITGQHSVLVWNFPYDWNAVKANEKKSLVKVLAQLKLAKEPAAINADEVLCKVKIEGEEDELGHLVPKRSLVNMKKVYDSVESVVSRVKSRKAVKHRGSENEEEVKKEAKESWLRLGENICSAVDEYRQSPVSRRSSIENTLHEYKSKIGNCFVKCRLRDTKAGIQV
eukprot:TRINITY_DN10244_c0_g4_i2.p1 TRINITY_DN10244_c0_g4~~TRINITY_DN10244_c0_g4_i2.p1  ORF type:complete len:419 (+),score=78.83 TRINITY_DN10244_c0_g4_i2:25-1257(+)